MKKYTTLKDLCEILGISYATGKNWIKTGKIIPSAIKNKTPLFTNENLDNLKNKIQKSPALLKNRRNKKYATGRLLYKEYIESDSPNITNLEKLIEYTEENNITIDKDFIITILAQTAKQFISNKNADFLIKDLLEERKNTPAKIPDIKFEYVKGEDTLGFIYISLNNVANRKATGSYYTPSKAVKKLCEVTFKTKENKTVLDPCCGSGNFLLNLPVDFQFENVYGGDTDILAVKITRINMYLKYGITDKEMLYDHIKVQDFLFSDSKEKYDYIIGNPPWAFEFSQTTKETLKKLYRCTKNNNIESYDIITEKAIQSLKKGGRLAFLLPEAILNVKSHYAIREIICSTTSIEYLEYLGDIFTGVQCPSIILILKNSPKSLNCNNTTIKTKERTYQITNKRKICAENLTFLTTDEEFQTLDKINSLKDVIYLKDNSDFALGIVTGNNKNCLLDKKDKTNEKIIKGTNLIKYGYKNINNYINFDRNKFQQVAPEKFYRAKEKLLYKFISKKLVFSYDNEQHLTLNSCNILIPKINNYNIKYILAILNSKTAQFYFSKTFNSTKVLRSHIESIPIPKADKQTQESIIKAVNKLLKSDFPEKTETYKKLDKTIAKLYKLTDKEYNTIQN